MTERLYFEDSTLLSFRARVVGRQEREGRIAIALDRTAFYPTGGGQPHDRGRLDSARVVDVVSDADSGEVWHVLEGASALETGDQVEGQVDPERRRDHTQQHSGQHVLSQSFVEVSALETCSFHLGPHTCTLNLEGMPDAATLRAAELRANEVVFANLSTRIHLVSREEAKRFPLRRETFTGEQVRIIEFDGFDWSTCGGTHVRAAGEIGLIAILGLEKIRARGRVQFVCGGRVLQALQERHRLLDETARLLTTGASEVPAKVGQLLADNRALRRRCKSWFEQAVAAQARDILAKVTPQDGVRLVRLVREDLSVAELKTLALELTREPAVVALLGLRDGTAGRLLFAKGAGLPGSMGSLLKDIAADFGGRGGGADGLAQGALADGNDLEEALEQAAARWRR